MALTAWPHPHLTARSEQEWQRLAGTPAAAIVFVFGSNLAGRHVGRHQQHAVECFGAQPGKGYGQHGKSYAMPVLDVAQRPLPITLVWGHVARFLQHADQNPELTFYVTAIGNGHFPAREIAPLFADRPDNVLLPPEWIALAIPVSHGMALSMRRAESPTTAAKESIVPHDKNGKVIQAGDIVNVPCRVTTVHTGEEYCNVSLETVEPMYPGDNKSTLTLNAKQVELIAPAVAAAPATEQPVGAE